MKIEKERNSIKITYSACATVESITALYDSIAARVAGVYLPSDVQHGKEGITLNVRHRESLQMFFEKNIFRIDDYIVMLKRLKEITASLRASGFEPGNCLWDVDAVFVGGSISELELVYLAEPERAELDNNTLTDFLAVVSLHVFDSRDSAIEALADAVNEFASFERTNVADVPGEAQFDRAIDILDTFSSGAGRMRRLIYCFWNKLKKNLRELFPGKAEKAEDAEKSEMTLPGPSAPINECGVSVVEKRVFLSDDAGSPYFELIDTENRIDINNNEAFALESRLIRIDAAIPEISVLDTVRRKEQNKTYPIGREYLAKQAGIYCPYVSRRHAQIITRGGEYVLTDLASRNGTYLNGDRLAPGSYYRVIKGDVISLAHVSLSFGFCA